MKSLLDSLKDYEAYCRFDKGLSTLTLKAYSQDLNQFLIYVGENKLIEEISRDVIRDFIKILFSKRLKETSIKRKVASLKAFLRFLEAENQIPVSPFRKLDIHIKVPRRTPKYLSLNDVRKIFSVANTSLAARIHTSYPQNDKSVPIDRRWFSAFQHIILIELLFSTGIRVSELSKLNINDIDLSKKTVKVSGKGSRERTVIMTNKDLLKILSQYLVTRQKMVVTSSSLLINRFNRRLQPHSVRSILRNMSVRAKLPIVTTPHMFRHTIATLLLENGVDIRFVQKFLGHSSILTTQMYTHLSTAAEREIIGAKHPRNFI